MSKNLLQEILAPFSQLHLLKHWNELNETQKESLSRQIRQINWDTFSDQQKVLRTEVRRHAPSLTSFHQNSFWGNQEDVKEGFHLIKEGALGCLVVAGGQGTRLKCNGPKGLFRISPIMNKSLFQLLGEKAAAASVQANTSIPIGLMTSTLNHTDTICHFEDHNFFGMKKGQISFFSQGTLPFLDREGNLFLEAPDTIAAGPDGNGTSLHHFYQSGIWKQWSDNGIRFVNFILIDNPLADPFDKNLLGFHSRTLADTTIKCIMRDDVNEKVGVIVYKNGHPAVVEYTEISAEERTQRQGNGKLKHGLANISLFCFSMDFIKKAALSFDKMPLHASLKKAKMPHEKMGFLMTEYPSAWKFERYIFDSLAFSNSVKALIYPREQCFAPLKNFDGEDSPATVRKALVREDKRIFKTLTGVEANQGDIELSQKYHYPTEKLVEECKKGLPSEGYIP